MVHWVVEISEFDIHYEPRRPIKEQVYADFLIQLTPRGSELDLDDSLWVLFIDDSSNL